MDETKLLRLLGGIDPWLDNFGEGMERRGRDGMSWYDLSINGNSIPCQTDTAVIVTCWAGQLKWLKAVLASYRMTGAFVIMAYDNPFYAWAEKNYQTMLRTMPNPHHYILANAAVHKHITYDSDKRNGWYWDVRYAQGVIKSFPNIKYIYCTNGDCIIERPEGLKEIIALLGGNDIMAGQSDGNVIHTADMIMKVEAFNEIFDFMYDKMRVPVIGSRSPEQMLLEAVAYLNIKVMHAPVQPISPEDGSTDYYCRYGQPSTWRDVLGFRNLFAEYETAGNEGKEPLPAKYVDNYLDWIYWGGEERETICKYWETGDRRYLFKYWDQWEDSDYNRLYYPLTHYGKDPIYATKDTA